MYILRLVIPTNVDTSQVPQQNVNLMPTVKAQISITCHSIDSFVPPPPVNTTCPTGCKVS